MWNGRVSGASLQLEVIPIFSSDSYGEHRNRVPFKDTYGAVVAGGQTQDLRAKPGGSPRVGSPIRGVWGAAELVGIEVCGDTAVLLFHNFLPDDSGLALHSAWWLEFACFDTSALGWALGARVYF